MDSDIEKINDYVLTLATKWQSRGKATQDLLVNLCKGFKACKDSEFVEYIKKKEDFLKKLKIWLMNNQWLGPNQV
jgi:hypothetical protein